MVDDPLQRALDEKWQLGRQLDEARRIAKSSGEWLGTRAKAFV